jgi:hypothetical protein
MDLPRMPDYAAGETRKSNKTKGCEAGSDCPKLDQIAQKSRETIFLDRNFRRGRNGVALFLSRTTGSFRIARTYP